MEIGCCDCYIVVRKVDLTCHIKKCKIRCDKCHEERHIANRWSQAVKNCGCNELWNMSMSQFIDESCTSLEC